MSFSANAGLSGPPLRGPADGGPVAPGVPDGLPVVGCELFSTRGVRGVGANQLTSRSSVARQMAGWPIDHHRVLVFWCGGGWVCGGRFGGWFRAGAWVACQQELVQLLFQCGEILESALPDGEDVPTQARQLIAL